MAAGQSLIVNADDFGQSPGINQGIIQAFEQGIVTSASLMVRWPAAGAAASYARDHPELSVGLHVDLGEWIYRDGEWVSLYAVIAQGDSDAVAVEIERQLDRFCDLMKQPPTHLDSHQHVHRSEPVRSGLIQIGDTLGVPLRHLSQVRYSGEFYGQTGNGFAYPEGVTAERLMHIVTALPAGITELGCHPGLGDDLESMYRRERAMEVQSLCDPRVCEHLQIEQVELCSFRDVPRLLMQPEIAG